MRTIEEPFNSNLMKNFGITDYYIAFPDFTVRDELREAQIEKVKAETAKLFIEAGFYVEYYEGNIQISKAPHKDILSDTKVDIIDVDEVLNTEDNIEKFEKFLKKKITYLKA